MITIELAESIDFHLLSIPGNFAAVIPMNRRVVQTESTILHFNLRQSRTAFIGQFSIRLRKTKLELVQVVCLRHESSNRILLAILTFLNRLSMNNGFEVLKVEIPERNQELKSILLKHGFALKQNNMSKSKIKVENVDRIGSDLVVYEKEMKSLYLFGTVSI